MRKIMKLKRTGNRDGGKVAEIKEQLIELWDGIRSNLTESESFLRCVDCL